MAHHRFIQSIDRRALEEHYRASGSCTITAKAFGISNKTVLTLLREQAIKINPRGRKEKRNADHKTGRLAEVHR